MGFKDYSSPVPEAWVTLGGTNSKTGKTNPTKIEGYYLGRSVTPSSFDDNKDKVTLVLQTPEGIVGVNSSANLTYKMNDSELNLKRRELSPLGMKVQIKFTGTKPSGKGNPTKLFSVLFDETDVKEVTPVATHSEATEEDEVDDFIGDNPDLEDSSEDSDEDTAQEAALVAARKAKVEADLKALKLKNQRKN